MQKKKKVNKTKSNRIKNKMASFMKGAVLSIGSQKNMFDSLVPKQNAPETEPVS
jgi:hypothetical protein